MEHFHRPVYRFCWRLLRSPDAEDLAQDTFVRAFVHFERFDPERPVLPWLFAIARRLCLDLLRRRKVMARVETMPNSGAPTPGPEGEASRREQLRRLERALDDLDEGPREAIVLFHIEEMSYRDIAAALEVPMGTVIAYSGHRDHSVRSIVITRSDDRDRSSERSDARAIVSSLDSFSQVDGLMEPALRGISR